MDRQGVISAVKEQFKTVLEDSDQPIYVYMDDLNKFCNKNFSSLLGYDSPAEWADIDASFPATFVAEASRLTLIAAYQDAMQRKVGTRVEITWKKKDGNPIPTQVILVPIEFDRQLLALHYIEER